MTGHHIGPDSQCAKHLIQTTTRQGSVKVSGSETPIAWEDWEEHYEGEGLDSGNALDGIKKECFSLRTISSLQVLDEAKINYELIEDLIQYIDAHEDALTGSNSGGGTILVFLPGMAEIQQTVDQLKTIRKATLKYTIDIIPLHSMISQQEQDRAFEPPLPSRRKVILATNIAETSLTIEDVVYVIDTGKAKEFRYDKARNLKSLKEVWVSQASAEQRKGRAGRVRDGICFRLFTEHRFHYKLDEFKTPEICSVPLEELCLQILNLGRSLLQGATTVSTFLSECIDPPSSFSVSSAIKTLKQIGAVSPLEGATPDSDLVELTPLGRHLAMLPVDVHVGKMLIIGAALGCVGPALTLAASISSKSVFYSPFEQRDAALSAK